MQEINRARSDGRVCGTEILPRAPALSWNDVLFSAAARHAQDMAQRNYFSHTTPDGVGFSDRLTAEGYRWSAVGENLASGQGSVAAVMQGWFGSEGHCRNIMTPVLTEVAVACVSSQGGNYWAMELGRP